MGRKKIVIFQYDCALSPNDIKEYADCLHNTIEKYGYAVADDRITIKEFEIEGIEWEEK